MIPTKKTITFLLAGLLLCLAWLSPASALPPVGPGVAGRPLPTLPSPDSLPPDAVPSVVFQALSSREGPSRSIHLTRLVHPTATLTSLSPQHGVLEYPYIRDGNIWITDRTGQSHHLLTSGGHDSNPVLSPDGRFVAYLSVPLQYLGSAPTPQDVCIVDILARDSTCLTDEPALRGSPVWSPNGTWLVYVEERELVLVSADRSERRVVATGIAIDGPLFATPAWSPNGDTLACVLDDGKGPAIWLVDVSAGPSRRLLGLEQYIGTPLAFSPDGSSVTFVNAYDEGRLWTIPLDGSDPIRMGETVTFVYDFSWSPSGDKIAYSKTDGSVWVLDLRTGTPREVGERTTLKPPPEVEWVNGGEDILLTVPTLSGTSLTILSLHNGEEFWLTPPAPDERLAPEGGVSPLGDIPAPFEWYRYQGEWDSGACASNNCGPTSVAMAIQFAHDNQWVSISDIRTYISGSDCRWTNLDDLRSALSHWGVDHTTITGMDAVRDAVNSRGHIVIVPVWMSYIPPGSDYLVPHSDPSSHYDRYYSYDSGHFVVVKGISDDNNWSIVHDPNVWDGNGIYWYSDDTAKGRSRYYSYSNFASAFANNGNQAIEILEVPAGGQVNWTVMVYLDGDNNLESAAIDDFLEMASVGSTANVKIVVLFDRTPGEDDSYGDWTDTRRGIINAGDVPTGTWGVSVGEKNMGDPQTLIDFVEWGMQNYPASNYAVVLWDHGSGWRRARVEETLPFKSVCVDDTSGDRLYMQEVRNALQTIETDEQEPDLVGFDACLMGMVEVAYEIREHASVMVGSEKTEPNDGWPYDTILSDLTGTPGMSAADLGSTIVSRYYQSYGNSEIMSAIDLASIDNLAAKTDSFAQALREHWNNDVGACVKEAADVMVAVDAAVIAEAHGATWPGSHGLAIYFPETQTEFNADYKGATILFPHDTRWEEFLQDFYASMGGSWVATARDQSQEYDTCPPNLCPHHIDLYDFAEQLTGGATGTSWVDFNYVGTENGTFDQPYNTLAEAIAAANPGDTICIKPGSSPETITITKAVTLRACGGPVTVGKQP